MSILTAIVLRKLHYTINILLTKAELFAIRCRINQAVKIPEVSHIIVITNAIHLVIQFHDSPLLVAIDSHSLRSQSIF